MNPNIVVEETSGMNTHGDELSAPLGSTSVADNIIFDRDRIPERRRGFKNYSDNLPDFSPEQLLVGSNGSDKYLHLDSGLWYHDGTRWLRKRGSFGAKSTSPDIMTYAAGHLYIGDTTNAVIHDLNLATGRRTILAGRFGVVGDTDGTGGAARFNTIGGICSDGTNLYVTDSLRHVIRKVVISTAVVTTIAGTAGANGTTDGTGAAARFDTPSGISTDTANIYVCDTVNHTIRKIVASSAVVTTLAGTAGASGDTDGTGSAARFNNPSGACCDGTSIFVTSSRDTIRKIVASSAVVTTLAGSAGTEGSTDATGTSARFKNPVGITTDNTNLYMCDTGNHTIRKIVISSAVVTTPAGAVLTTGSVDGIGSAALFNNPRAIASDGVDVYICDYSNNLIRKLYLSTSYVATFAGSAGVVLASPGIPLVDGIVVGPT